MRSPEIKCVPRSSVGSFTLFLHNSLPVSGTLPVFLGTRHIWIYIDIFSPFFNPNTHLWHYSGTIPLICIVSIKELVRSSQQKPIMQIQLTFCSWIPREDFVQSFIYSYNPDNGKESNHLNKILIVSVICSSRSNDVYSLWYTAELD